MAFSPDAPIENPSQDLFGLDPFAQLITNSIRGVTTTTGIVLAINGQWGSGKSSAINLVRYHLKPDLIAGRIVPVIFNPWWFAGADALVLAFFQQLELTIGPSLSRKARKALRATGQTVSAAGQVLGAAADLKAPGLGSLISGAATLVGRITSDRQTVEQEHQVISEALLEKKKRFLVIIDDLDRLDPDDALTIFRLIKSVGQLPNVIYLLAFDRELAERAISERFPSEGPSYLEKIIQNHFDLPPPPVDLLRQRALNGACEIVGQPTEAQAVRFMNIFYDIIAPLMRTPRDAVRFINALMTTWPAVAQEVDRADFIALTALRLSAPKIYRGIRAHANELCGAADERGQRNELPNLYDQMLGLTEYSGQEREQWRRALRRLFPRLDAVWANTWHTDSDSWRRERRICSKKYFDTYFAFSISEEVLPASELQTFIDQAENSDYVVTTLRNFLRTVRSNGSTKVALLLEELTIHAADVSADKVEVLVLTIFALADELDVPEDRGRGFTTADNNLRIHWLMNRLVTDRFDPTQRMQIYSRAMERAAAGWCADFAERCVRYYKPNDNDKDRNLGEPIVTEEAAQAFCVLALAKLRAAAQDTSLINHQHLPRLIFEWKRLSGDDQEVRRWTDSQLINDRFIIAMAEKIPSVGWTQGLGFDGMGDRVARRSVTVDLAPYADVLDVSAFQARVAALLEQADLAPVDREILQSFRAAPPRHRSPSDAD